MGAESAEAIESTGRRAPDVLAGRLHGPSLLKFGQFVAKLFRSHGRSPARSTLAMARRAISALWRFASTAPRLRLVQLSRMSRSAASRSADTVRGSPWEEPASVCIT